MNDQLILKFPEHRAYKKEDFYVSPSNQEAYDLVNNWPKWIKRIVNIFGPSASGKSHLASILKAKTKCLEISPNELNENAIFEFKTREALIFENFNEKISEELFSAVRTEFKHLEYYYFHNFLYSKLIILEIQNTY